jgi:hypothetical protein
MSIRSSSMNRACVWDFLLSDWKNVNLIEQRILLYEDSA